jgi:hypothetical protein
VAPDKGAFLVGITNKQRGGQLLPGLGAWMDVPFDAANFSATSGMVWTVTPPVFQNRVSRIGNTVTWSGVIAASTLSGTPSAQIVLKAPTKAKGYASGIARVINSAPPVMTFISVSPGGAGQPGYVAIALPGSAPFALGTLQVYFTVQYEVEP